MREFASSGETVEYPYGLHQKTSPLLCLGFLIQGVVLLIAMLTHLPMRMIDIQRASSAGLAEVQVLLALFLGFSFFAAERTLGHHRFIYAARLCFLVGLCIGGYALWFFLHHFFNDMALQHNEAHWLTFFNPMPAYKLVSLGLLSWAFFLATLIPRRGAWLQSLLQGLGILFMSLGVSSLFQALGNWACSDSTWLGFISCIYGGVLLFLPFENHRLAAPFFSTPRIRLYTAVLCSLWIVLIGWQTLLGTKSAILASIDAYFGYFDHTFNKVVIGLFSSLILGFGLRILYNLSEREKLARLANDSVVRLRESLDSVALLGSTLSHDLKAPILIQMKALEMLSSGHYGNEISTPENQEILSAILDNNQFELDLVLNLINLLRYKIQDTEFDPKLIKIQPFLEDIRKEVSPLAVRRQQQLQINVFLEPEVTLSADPLGLKRVIHNLLNNAILHLPEGRHIQVDVERRADDFLFSVRDNGPGIPEEKLGTLFNQVNRISSSGLGLYISKQIVERHGGRIWVESQLNQGTCFYFTLPQTSILGRTGKFSNLEWLSKPQSNMLVCLL